jgi:hypothetical protein
MLRLDKVIKPWKDSAALNDHINLYGFWNETAFLAKSGDLGMVLSVPGVDYESLDRSEQEYSVKRLEAALKGFGPGFHVYQYLFKSNRPDIPFATYDDPIVEAAIDQRRKFFEAKRDHLYQVEIFYCILIEGARSKTGVGAALARLLRDPEGAIAELKSQFTNDNMKTLLRTHIERDVQRLDQHVQAFARQLADFMQIEVLNRQGQFMFFRRLLNYDDWRVAGKPRSTQFLDYQVVNSDIEVTRHQRPDSWQCRYTDLFLHPGRSGPRGQQRLRMQHMEPDVRLRSIRQHRKNRPRLLHGHVIPGRVRLHQQHKPHRRITVLVHEHDRSERQDRQHDGGQQPRLRVGHGRPRDRH